MENSELARAGYKQDNLPVKQYKDLDTETLASDEELKLIEALRNDLSSDLQQLKDAGCDFPHTTGDIFMLRVVRGCDGDIQSSVKWYRNYLAVRKEHGLDAIHKSFIESGKLWIVEEMPHAEEVRKNFNTHFDETRMVSLDGHFLWFDSVGTINATQLLKDEDAFKYFISCVAERRMSRLDDLSREQGRIVKIVRIWDCDGLTPWSLSRDLLKLFRGFMMPMIQQTSIEANHRFFMLNTNWFVVQLSKVYLALMPERARVRMRLIGRDFMEDKELFKYVTPSQLNDLIATGHQGEDDGQALEGTQRRVAPGNCVSKAIKVDKGQTVSWSFCLGLPSEGSKEASRGLAARMLDMSLGEGSDLVFSVGFWPEGDSTRDVSGDALLDEEVLIPATKVDAKGGDQAGSVDAPSNGTIVVSWSNYASWVRPKLILQYKIEVK